MQTAPVSEIQPAIALLEKTPLLFETLLGNLPLELLQWKPGPERWSISEVLAHLADIEQEFCERVRRITAENTPALQRYDQARAENYSSGTAAEHLARFGAMRRGIAAFLKSLPASAGMRTANHSELGTITLAQLLNEWASHDLGHLRQVAEVYRAHAFYPYAGPFQKYSNPKP
jgi:uncharacterized damage-inducible protein DinB